jgi:hypothetical protein
MLREAEAEVRAVGRRLATGEAPAPAAADH